VFFVGLDAVAVEVVKAGGLNLSGIFMPSPVTCAIASTKLFIAFGFTHLALAITAVSHAFPSGSDRFWHELAELITPLNIAKGLYAVGWAAALFIVGVGGEWIVGYDLFGTPVWFFVILARTVCFLLGEVGYDRLPGCKGVLVCVQSMSLTDTYECMVFAAPHTSFLPVNGACVSGYAQQGDSRRWGASHASASVPVDSIRGLVTSRSSDTASTAHTLHCRRLVLPASCQGHF
jgi:hypothetical protein